MRDKAHAGFGGRALVARGLDLNKSAGSALAKRAKKFALDLEAHFEFDGAPFVMIGERGGPRIGRPSSCLKTARPRYCNCGTH